MIGVDTAHGEPPLLGTPIAARLTTTARLRATTVAETPLPETLDALLILAPRRPFREAERRTIDQFLMTGKAVVALLDYRETTPATPGVLVPVTSGLEELFRAYGVQIESQALVLDPQSSLPVRARNAPDGRPIVVSHPLFVIAQINPGHPVTAGIERVVVPMAAPIRLTAKDGVVTLLRAAPTARARDRVRAFDPAPLRSPQAGDRPGPFPLAVAVTRTFESAFRGSEPPPECRGPSARPACSSPPAVAASCGPIREACSSCRTRSTGRSWTRS